MLIIPAIDILGGKAVRLKQGDFNQVTEFNTCPLAQAKTWQNEGASLLHIVDLDGAKNGQAINQAIIFKILSTLKIPVQIGGGIRTYETAARYLSAGAARIILGSSAVNDLALVKKLINSFGSDRISVGLDLKNSQIAINGWQENSKKDLASCLGELKAAGVTQLIITDILKDGLELGPNFEISQQFSGFEVIMSGGVSTLSDLQRLASENVKGAIVGKALYTGRLKLTDAQESLQAQNPLCKRIIPCLDIADSWVVKGRNFKNLEIIGEPLKLAQQYAQEQADEIAILDITATVQQQENLLKTSTAICKNLNIPITVGGGIKKIADIRALLKAGADKVCIGTAAVLQPELIAEAAQEFGSQAIVVSLDTKKTSVGDWQLNIRSGSEATAARLIPFAKKIAALGAGELLVNSIDQDGTKQGCDLRLLSSLRNEVNCPIIASSGLGSEEDFLDVFSIAKADAALAAGIFHRQELSIPSVKNYLTTAGVRIRC